MFIRPYRADDLTVIHRINEAAVPAVGTETVDDLGHIAAESVISLVATDTATDIAADTAAPDIGGFCLVLAPGADYHSGNYLWFADRYDDFVYLDRIAIEPSFQRRGWGRALYAEVERLAADVCPSARRFTLEVNLEPRNDTSLAFHAALGFVEVGQRSTEYGTVVSLMAKSLVAD